jgi:hypothetical protein
MNEENTEFIGSVSDEVGRLVPEGEAGFDGLGQKRTQKNTTEYSALERNRPHREYIIFKSPEDKKYAIRCLEEARVDDAFRYLTDWRDDSERRDVGIELTFSKSPENNIQKVVDFFARQKSEEGRTCIPVETYFDQSQEEQTDVGLLGNDSLPKADIQNDKPNNVIEMRKSKKDKGLSQAA